MMIGSRALINLLHASSISTSMLRLILNYDCLLGPDSLVPPPVDVVHIIIEGKSYLYWW